MISQQVPADLEPNIVHYLDQVIVQVEQMKAEELSKNRTTMICSRWVAKSIGYNYSPCKPFTIGSGLDANTTKSIILKLIIFHFNTKERHKDKRTNYLIPF